MHCSSTLPRRDIKSHFPQVPSASRMHCSLRIPSVTPKATLRECPLHPVCIVLPRSSSVINKPLSVSALRIPHALFSLQQRHQKPLSASALGILHASFLAPAASSKAAFRKRTWHPACIFLLAPAASSKSHFLQVPLASRMPRSWFQ